MGKLLGNSQPESHTCPVYSLDENAAQPLFGDVTFRTFNEILSGACAAFVLLVMLGHQLNHANHFSKPNEQYKILRISLMIPIYSLFSFLSVLAPTAEVYLAPWLDVFQGWALANFFLLMCEFVSPSDSQRDVFFAGLTIPNKKGKVLDGVAWYRTRWIMIFQYPAVAVLVAILTDVTQAAGVYCQYISKPYFARLWLSLIGKASLSVAFYAVFRCYVLLRTPLAKHQLLAKLVAFKAVVGLTFLQSIVFWILSDTSSALSPTPTMTYGDINIGIPALLTCVEMVPLSLVFVWAYSCSPYKIQGVTVAVGEEGWQKPVQRKYQGGALGLGAWAGMWNPMETLRGIAFAFNMVTSSTDRDTQAEESREMLAYRAG